MELNGAANIKMILEDYKRGDMPLEDALSGIEEQNDLLLDYLRAVSEVISKRFVLGCLLYTSPSPRDGLLSRMPSSA